MPADNPLLVESVLPYHLPPFDKIKDEHFVPAIEAGMREQLKEVEPIAAQFGETDVRQHHRRAGANRTIARSRAANFFEPERLQHQSDPCRRSRRKWRRNLSAHHDAILLNSKLFARIQELYDNREKLGLDPESAYLLERYYKDFVRAGAKLSDPDKEKLKKINAELATLQTQFEQNVLKEKNASSVVVDRKEDLAGLSDNQMASGERCRESRAQGRQVRYSAAEHDRPAIARLVAKSCLARAHHAGLALAQ